MFILRGEGVGARGEERRVVRKGKKKENLYVLCDYVLPLLLEKKALELTNQFPDVPFPVSRIL